MRTKASPNGSAIFPPNGAGVQLSPMTSVVTRWVILDRLHPSRISGMMEWLWMSMKPGHTTIPAASTSSRAFPAGMRPGGAMSAIRSPCKATSPWYQGLPVPSTTRAPRIKTSISVPVSYTLISPSSWCGLKSDACDCGRMAV